jgi:CRP-like cAMP-binding protein
MKTDVEMQFSALAQQMGIARAGELRSQGTIRNIPAGTLLIGDGQPVDSLYLILDGVMSVSVDNSGRSLHLGRLGKGKWIGDVSLLSGEPLASSGVAAETPATLLELKHAVFRRLAVERPELANSIVRALIDALAERVRASDALIGSNGGGGLALEGSERVVSLEAGKDRGRLKSMLQKLAGVEAE